MKCENLVLMLIRSWLRGTGRLKGYCKAGEILELLLLPGSSREEFKNIAND